MAQQDGTRDVTLETPLHALLANKRRVSALKKLGVLDVRDALTYYPFRVTDPVPVRALVQAQPGLKEKMACAVRVRSVRVSPMNARAGYRVEVLVDDDEFAATLHVRGALATLVFFSHRKSYVDWLAGRLRVDGHVVSAGDPTMYMDRLQFTHPELLTVGVGANLRADVGTVAEGLQRVCRPRPVYHANSRISSEHIHDTIIYVLRLLAGEDPATAMHADDETAQPHMRTLYAESEQIREHLDVAIPDILPGNLLAELNLMHRAQAFPQIHDPDSVGAFTQAITTMRYEEAFVCQSALIRARHDAREHNAYVCSDVQLRDEYIDTLPFSLTKGQREVVDEISHDMCQDHPMQRLLQGEVGSGKTVVAVSAMLQAVGSGHQAVLVAPTQVLAEQHYQSISNVFNRAPVLLLTGGMKLAERRKVLGTATSGEPCIVVATHAAFSKSFQAPNLALAVIDEQHRFGVEQRETLRSKSDVDPHLLVMTATPIPRTAAMTWFGDLDISWLTELPGGRKPIQTVVIPEVNAPLMAEMFWHIRHRIDAGERAYIVCPRIDEQTEDAAVGDNGGDSGGTAGSAGDARADFDDGMLLSDEDLGETNARAPLHSVHEISERLQSLPQFQGVRFCELTGRDDDATKERVMAEFASGQTPVMVATTVIEVGVDVPQASCIVIFDADRYGLSQLHQLRGRVGRGGTHSWAFLVSQAEPNSIAEQRLDVIAHSLDGALIAQKDLELRGAGDVLGDTQSGGRSSLKLLRVVKDAAMITDARNRAELLLDADPTLEHHTQLAGAVLDFSRGNEKFLTSN